MESKDDSKSQDKHSTNGSTLEFARSCQVPAVSNIPMTIAQPRALFNQSKLPATLTRVKTPNKLNCALIEFTKATFAMIARNHLDQFAINGQKWLCPFHPLWPHSQSGGVREAPMMATPATFGSR